MELAPPPLLIKEANGTNASAGGEGEAYGMRGHQTQLWTNLSGSTLNFDFIRGFSLEWKRRWKYI
jgi:hypothetical protein